MRRPLADAGLFFVLIILIVQLLNPTHYPDLSNLDSRFCLIEGTLCEIEYRPKDDVVQTVFYISNINILSPFGDDINFSKKDKIVCYMKDVPSKILLGSRIVLKGKMHAYEPAYNPGNFNPREYNRIMHNIMSMSESTVTDLIYTPDSVWWKYRSILCDIRHILSQICDICFVGEDASIAKAMLLGEKSYLSQDTKDLYSQGGISHILAISGLHISLIGMALFSFMKRCRIPVIPNIIISIMIMFSYGILCGMAASALRAIIMFILRMLSIMFKRTYDLPTAFILAADLILIEQPLYLFYSGFQFSFGAILAVMLVIPSLNSLFHKLVSAGLCINLTTLPVYLYNYYYFPFLSILLNLYVIPLMSLLLVLMLIAVIISCIFLPLGKLIAYPVHLILMIYEYSCKLINIIPFGKMVTGQPSTYQIAIYYIMLTSICILVDIIPPMITKLLILISCSILSANLRYGLTVTAIDVGQGDSLFITDYHNYAFLIDCGSSSINDVARYRISPFLLSQGCAMLDAVFLTHSDSDHVNALAQLIQTSGKSSPLVGKIVIPNYIYEECSGNYDLLCKLLSIDETSASRKPVLTSVIQGDTYSGKSMNMYCIYPDSQCHGEDSNAESLVLMLNHEDINILFTGDIEGKGEQAITEIIRTAATSAGWSEYADIQFSDGKKPSDLLSLSTNILKAAHHGSKNSSNELFLDAYQPSITLISAGRGNSYGHPHREMLSRLESRSIPYFTTSDYGAISLHIRQKNIYVSGYLQNK